MTSRPNRAEASVHPASLLYRSAAWLYGMSWAAPIATDIIPLTAWGLLNFHAFRSLEIPAGPFLLFKSRIEEDFRLS
jgi:hypothetical protein